MPPSYNLSPDLRLLLHKTAENLGMEVILHRQNDAPRYGILVDDYTFGSGKNVIVFPSSVLGMLKDYIIAENSYRLLFNGMGAKAGRFKVLSYSKSHAVTALKQIYLDILKDEKTRNMDLWRKKKLLFYLYILFLETLSEIPWTLLSNLLISVHLPVMRNAQIYFLLKESMRDMHELVTVKDFLPQRYFVMHNAMYYARDNVLAYMLSEFKLNPVINIPELQKFKNLDMKEMMSHRWSSSVWYHTKMVGDAMSTILKGEITIDAPRLADPATLAVAYDCGVSMTNRWIGMMGMEDWYYWTDPADRRAAFTNQDAIEAAAIKELFAE